MSSIQDATGPAQPGRRLADPPGRWLAGAAGLSFGAGLAHLWYAPAHLADWVGAGLFFLVAGVAQIALAVRILLRPRPSLFLVGAAGNLGVIATYALARTSGVPFGPHAGIPEPPTLAGTLVTGAESLLVALLVALVLRAPGALNPSAVPRRPVLVPALLAVAVFAGAAAADAGGHDHGAVAHARSSAGHAADHALTGKHPSVIHIDGSRHHPSRRRAFPDVSCDRGAAVVEPIGAPTGPRIAYSDWTNLFVYDVASDATTRLTSNGERCGSVSAPRFRSPTELTYVQGETHGRRYRSVLYSVDLLTGRRDDVFRAPDRIGPYAWDPSGAAVAYAIWDEQDGTDVRIVDAATGAERVLARLPDRIRAHCGSEASDGRLEWSSDGTKLLLVQTAFDNQRTLQVIGLDGEAVVAPREGTFGRWLDATTVLYRDPFQTGAWFVLDLTTDTERPLGARANTFNASVSPDGGAFAAAEREGGVWVYDRGAEREVRLPGTLVRPGWLDGDRVVAMEVEQCRFCYWGWEPTGSAVIVEVATSSSMRIDLPHLWDATVFPWVEAPEPEAPDAAPNRAPVIDGIEDRTVRVLEEVAIAVVASDPDGDPVTIAARSLPDGASFDGRSFTWTPVPGQEGTWTVVFVASDGELRSRAVARITVVSPITVAPVLVALGSVGIPSLLARR